MSIIKIERHKGEMIRIGKFIRIVVLGRSGDEIRIGVEAPKNMKIRRAELVTIKEEVEKINKLLPIPLPVPNKK